MSVSVRGNVSGSNRSGAGLTSAFFFARASSLTITPVTATQSFWDYAISGDHMYCASHSDGVTVLDISTPTAPTVVDTVYSKTAAGANNFDGCTDVVIVGTKLVMCSRAINLAKGGYITMYDISTPASPSWTGSYDIPAGVTYGNWPQGLDTDGTYVYCATQEGGLIVFDISGVAPTVHGSLTTGDWETSRIAVHSGYCYMANHGFGLRIVDIATPATPGAVTDREIDMPTVNSVDLRIRNVVCDGNYLYASPNTAGTTNDEERGLLVLDITDPTTVPTNGSTWVVESIADADVDTWNGAGDKPILGIAKLNDYVYLSNGQRGAAVFEVSDPTTPQYMGLFKGSIADETNLYKVEPFTKDGVYYAYYGDGRENTQKHTLYVDVIKNP